MTSKIEKIVDYAFEKNEKSNVLAIHQTRPLLAYLITIQRTQKISKAWSSTNDPNQSPSSASINGQQNIHQNNNTDKNKTVSIRIIDYATRQRCLAKGIYHARPVDCVFTINSITCSHADIIKLAVVDRLANIYLYDLTYFINELTATRIAVIRSPGYDVSPYEFINLVWCPFVPCEDFDDGDGGLRLALSTNSKIEIFAIDRLQGKTGELQRNELQGAYKCINDAHRANIVSLSISPDCSTISAAASDNRVTFFSSDIDDSSGKRCLHNWEANITDKSSISRLFFLDDYPKLLEDNTMKFWGAAFIGTKSGHMILVNLRTWSVYQKMDVSSDLSMVGPKNFDYRIDLTSRNIIAINGSQCYVVQIEHHGLPKIVRTTSLKIHNPIYSFVIKHKTDFELELFTISAFSLERHTINLVAINSEPQPSPSPPQIQQQPSPILRQPYQQPPPQQLQQQQHQVLLAQQQQSRPMDIELPPKPPQMKHLLKAQQLQEQQLLQMFQSKATQVTAAANQANPDVTQMDKIVEALFTKLNTTFSQGLDEFLNDVKCEVNDLKSKLNELCRDVRKLQQQMIVARQY